MKPITDDKKHCFKHASTHRVDEQCPYCRAETAEAALSAERADHQLTLDTFRKQEAIWNEKLAVEIAAREAAMRCGNTMRDRLLRYESVEVPDWEDV